MQQLIDIACMQNSQQQTRYTLLQQANVTDRQTDGCSTISQTLLRILCKQCQLSVSNWRVDDVERHVHDVRDQVHVALSASAATVFTKWLLKSKLDQQMLQVMNRVRVRGVPHGCAFLQVSVVSAQTQTRRTYAKTSVYQPNHCVNDARK